MNPGLHTVADPELLLQLQPQAKLSPLLQLPGDSGAVQLAVHRKCPSQTAALSVPLCFPADLTYAFSSPKTGTGTPRAWEFWTLTPPVPGQSPSQGSSWLRQEF